MARLEDRPEQFFKRQLDGTSRVLLINPPVHERRYHWIRWNQPTELLKLSTWLKGAHPGIQVRLFDFMFPDLQGDVPKHKVKSTWPDGAQLWHFGVPFETFSEQLARYVRSEGWIPDAIVISSLTSYWHLSIEELLRRICQGFTRQTRKQTKLVLYGNYPRFEPEHAATQSDADVAMKRTVVTTGLVPDFNLCDEAHGHGPNFFGLDVEDPAVEEHLESCVAMNAATARTKSQRPRPITVAFFNDDICGTTSRLDCVEAFTRRKPGTVVFEGIVGVRPESLSPDRIQLLEAVGFRSLFVEHARMPGGDLNIAAYESLLDAARAADHAKKSGSGGASWLERGGGADRGGLTAFVSIGLPDDDMDKLVRSTLLLNKHFQSIILKPFGYSPLPTVGAPGASQRRLGWSDPSMGSPHCFPYADAGSGLTRRDYDDLMSWQNLLNRRVKGRTFDFLDDGVIARLVRETVIAESWKPRVGVQ